MEVNHPQNRCCVLKKLRFSILEKDLLIWSIFYVTLIPYKFIHGMINLYVKLISVYFIHGVVPASGPVSMARLSVNFHTKAMQSSYFSSYSILLLLFSKRCYCNHKGKNYFKQRFSLPKKTALMYSFHFSARQCPRLLPAHNKNENKTNDSYANMLLV